MAGLEGSPSGSLLPDIQQIPADLRLAQLIRRPSVMLGQAADRLLINFLCLVGQSSQLHVLNHAGAQRRHRLLLRLLHTDGTTPPRQRRIAAPARLRPCRYSLRRSRSVQPAAALARPRLAHGFSQAVHREFGMTVDPLKQPARADVSHDAARSVSARKGGFTEETWAPRDRHCRTPRIWRHASRTPL